MFALNSKYEILTPTGWKKFRGVSKTESKNTYKISLSNGKTVVASNTHYFFLLGRKRSVDQLVVGDLLDVSAGFCSIIKKEFVGKRTTFDIVECGDVNHQFYVEGEVTTKNCDEFAFVRPNMASEFWTSIQPVLSTGGSCIITSTPKSDEDQFAQIWKGANDNLDEYGQVLPGGRGRNDFFPLKFAWHAHPERDEEWAKPFRNSLGPAKFAQEFECVVGSTSLELLDPQGNEVTMSIDSLTGILRANGTNGSP